MKEAAGACGGCGELWDLNRFSFQERLYLATGISRKLFARLVPDEGIGISWQMWKDLGDHKKFVFRDETDW
jgi:hypothetical protein